jgi:pyruvate formate lyase activating enzyme
LFDLHVHILPGIDDGPRTLEEALEMARVAVADGITTMVATPHLFRRRSVDFHDLIRPQDVRQAVARFNEQLAEEKIDLTVLPGSEILSVATYGCNLRCPFCQNVEISQQVTPSRHVEPDELLALAKHHGTPSLAYTYNEPCIWFEYLMDAGKLMQGASIKNVLVTNGMLSPEPLAELLPLIAAMNIDLKSIRPEFYRDYVQGDLDTVLNTIRTAARVCHVELTNLIIPTLNDSQEEITEMVDWIYYNTGADTPLHFSRYFPCYKMNIPATPIETLMMAEKIAKRKLKHTHVGQLVDQILAE